MKPTPLTDDDLKALTDHEMRNAVGYFGGKLSEQRRKAEIYYLGLPKLDLSPPEVDGRSSVVSTDVRNTIESMLPQLMAKFVGGEQVVEFEPTQADDEEKAKSCTDYLNYLFFKKNNGHRVVYTWFKDALLLKNGIIKVWWDTRAEEKREEYKGLTQVELAQLLDDDEVEPIDQKSYPDEEDAEQRKEAVQQITQQLQQAMQAAQQPGPQQQQAMQAAQGMQQHLAQIQAQPPAMLYDVSFKRTLSKGKITIDNVPPEEFLISRQAKSIESASFVAHRVSRTLSELRSMGYKNVDTLESDDAAASLNAERIERDGYDDEMAYRVGDDSSDASQRTVWVTECYIKCDYDGDGISELRKVVRAGNVILDNEVVDCTPFVSITPVPMPHKFFGLSIADLGMETQKTKTNVLRAMQDNLFLQVNGRYFAVNGQVNLDDLLTSRPGGVVRVDSPGAVGRLDQGAGDIGSANNMLEFLEQDLEQRTGWTRYSQGNDSKALNQTATGVQIITNKGDMRTDLIARNFAEGFVELFRLMLKLVSQHQDKETQIRVSGQWVDMDPRQWRNMFDVNINVGLGIGSKDEQVQKLMALGDKQAQAMAIGIASPENVYHLMKDLSGLMGHKNSDKYWTDPAKNPPLPQPDPEQAKAQAQMQIEQAKGQMTMQIEQGKAQLQDQQQQRQLAADQQTAQMQAQLQAQLQAHEQSVQAQQNQHQNELEAEREQQKAQLNAQLESLRTQADERLAVIKDQSEQRRLEFDRWKVEMDNATKISIAEISAKTAMSATLAKAEATADTTVTAELPDKPDSSVMDAISKMAERVDSIHAQVNKPPEPRKSAKLVRGKDGKATHVDHGGELIPIQRDASGRVEGI